MGRSALTTWIFGLSNIKQNEWYNKKNEKEKEWWCQDQIMVVKASHALLNPNIIVS
jgi:nucleoside-specific outer membrane channel protein Tsx